MYYLGEKQEKVSKVTGRIFKNEIILSYKFFGAMVAFFCFCLPCRGKEGIKVIHQGSEERCLCSFSS